jgi:hypothetical protein
MRESHTDVRSAKEDLALILAAREVPTDDIGENRVKRRRQQQR